MPPKRAAAAKKGAAGDAPAASAASTNKANTGAKVTKPKAEAKKPNSKAGAKMTKGAEEKEEKKAPAKRGRPPKKQPTPPVESEADESSEEEEEGEDEDDAKVESKTKTTKTKGKANGTAPKKPVGKKAAAPKKDANKAESPAPAKRGRKRKADDEEADDKEPAKAPKKPKAAPKVKPRTVINYAPTERLHVYVFGEGTAGELGLGTEKNCIDVKRPRLNAKLDAQTVGVVQVVAGGMHNVALTHDGKILTWGVNDQGALGRDTTWDGGVKDIDAEDSDSDDDDTGLNPLETTPTEVDFSKTEDLDNDVVWVEVAAGDSCSFALTNDGKVYGWGTFRGNEGIFGFAKDVYIATRPMLIAGLKNITSIKAGANHALALDNKGHVFAWGSGQQNQLGRKVVERTKVEGLTPREFGLPKGANSIASIETGGYHSFAISKNGDVWSWGLNNFGETGIPDNAGQDDAVILKPQVVQGLQGKKVVSIKGGGHHSVCALDNGDCLVWGRLDGNQCGLSKDKIAEHIENTVRDERGEPRILTVPTKVDAIDAKVVKVTACSDHNIVVTEDGRAYSWGFSANYQTGQGTIDDVVVATLIDNTALRAAKLNGCTTGGQFSIVTGMLTDNPDVGKK